MSKIKLFRLSTGPSTELQDGGSDQKSPSKGASFPVMAIHGVDHMSGRGEDEKEEAQVLYATATQRLVVTVSGNAGFGKRLGS